MKWANGKRGMEGSDDDVASKERSGLPNTFPGSGWKSTKQNTQDCKNIWHFSPLAVGRLALPIAHPMSGTEHFSHRGVETGGGGHGNLTHIMKLKTWNKIENWLCTNEILNTDLKCYNFWWCDSKHLALFPGSLAMQRKEERRRAWSQLFCSWITSAPVYASNLDCEHKLEVTSLCSSVRCLAMPSPSESLKEKQMLSIHAVYSSRDIFP